MDIKRRTRRVFYSEEEIRLVLEGLKGEEMGFIPHHVGDTGP
jgi:hypothetical protein